MEDYKEYNYGDTLRMLDGWYDHDTEDVNDAHVLLSMSRCDSIKECIKIYKRVYEKYQEYMNSTSQSGHKSFDEDLNACLNENILRLLKSKGRDIGYDFANSCLANIRQCKDIKKHQSDWHRLVQLDENIPNVLMAESSIIEAQKNYEESREEFLRGRFQPGTNGFKRMKSGIVDNLDVLKNYGYVMAPSDISFLVKNETQAGILVWGGAALVLIILIIWIGFEGIFGLLILLGLGSVMLSVLKWVKG